MVGNDHHAITRLGVVLKTVDPDAVKFAQQPAQQQLDDLHDSDSIRNCSLAPELFDKRQYGSCCYCWPELGLVSSLLETQTSWRSAKVEAFEPGSPKRFTCPQQKLVRQWTHWWLSLPHASHGCLNGCTIWCASSIQAQSPRPLGW